MCAAGARRRHSPSGCKKLENVSVRLLTCTEYLFILVTNPIVKM